MATSIEHAATRMPATLRLVARLVWGHLRDTLFGLIALVQIVGFALRTSNLSATHCLVFQSATATWQCQSADDQLTASIALLVAIGLWALALIVWVVGRGMPAAIVFFLAFQVSAGTLTAGDAPDDEVAASLLFAVLTCAAAVLLFLSLRALLDDPDARAWRRRFWPRACMWCILGANAVTALLAISPPGTLGRWLWQTSPSVLVGPTPGRCDSCSPFPDVANTALYATFIVTILATYVYTAAGYRATPAATTRRRLRLLLVGNAAAFLPMVLLSLAATLASNGRTYVSFALTFPFLLLYPLIYLYALFAGRLTRFQPRLSAFATYYLSAISLLGLYLVAAGFLGQFPGVEAGSPVPGAGATMLVLLAAFPLHNAFRRVVRWAWADEATDPVRLNALLTERLKLITDGDEFNCELITALADGLYLSGAALLRPGQDEGQMLATGSGALSWITGYVPLDAATIGDLAADASERGPLAPSQTHAAVLAALAALAATHLDWPADGDQPTATLPLVQQGTLRGVILLGPRRFAGQQDFSPGELRHLAAVSYQAAVALHNIALTVRDAEADERFGMEMAHRLDRERARIADELHDGPIQEMVALGWLLDEAEGQLERDAHVFATVQRARTRAHEITERLRDIMYSVDVDTAGVVGFGPALEGALDAIRARGWPRMPDIYAEISHDLPPMSQELQDCLIDIAREAVFNACKYAGATTIRVVAQAQGRTTSDNNVIVFEVNDDGCGFLPRLYAGSSAHRAHTGLFRMRRHAERVCALFTCDSTLDSGTCIRVQWPAPPTKITASTPAYATPGERKQRSGEEMPSG